MGRAESLIRGEAIRFMHQQQSASKSNLEMVLVDQPVETQPAEAPTSEPEPSSSTEPPPSVPAQNIFMEILMKYGYKRSDPPVIVIAKPIPSSEPASPPPPPPVIRFSRSRVKSCARKGAATSEPSEPEEEEPVQFRLRAAEHADGTVLSVDVPVVAGLEPAGWAGDAKHAAVFCGAVWRGGEREGKEAVLWSALVFSNRR